MQALTQKAFDGTGVAPTLSCKLALPTNTTYKNKSVPPLNRMNAMRNIFEKVI
jgi:hypothetical protein